MYTYTQSTGAVSIVPSKSVLEGVNPYEHSESFELYLTDTITIGSLNLTPGVRYTSVDYTYTN